MTALIGVIAFCQGVRTMLDLRAERRKGLKIITLVPRRLRRRKHRGVRITEMP